MSRVKTPDGKRVSLGLKVSEAKAAWVDKLRGDTPRALWLESLVDAAIASASGGMPAVMPAPPERKRRPPAMHGQQAVIPRPVPKDSPGSPPPQPPPAPARTVDEAAARLAELRAKALASDVEPISDPAELARRSIEGHIEQIAAQSAPKRKRDPKTCKHENMQMIKGSCDDCGVYGVKGKAGPA